MLEIWNSFRQFKPGLVGLAIILIATLGAIAAPLISAVDPKGMVFSPVSPPQSGLWFGTDNYGRDLFTRVLYGTRVSLSVAVISAGISAVLGIVLGAIPGYYGGPVDDFTSRATEIFQMIPVFFLLIVTAAIFGSTIYFVIIAIGLTTWPSNARIMRSQVLSLKKRPYVVALVSTGASVPRILFRHIIPNGVYPVITNSALRMGSAMLTEAGLSFLGLGDPNVISWGQMIQGGQLMLNIAPWASFFPGLALLLLVCAFNLVGDGLNFAMNPRLQAR